MDRYVQSIRYPPFELEHMNPRDIPISKAAIDNYSMSVTSFTIGSEDDWFVQWRVADEEDAELQRSQMVEAFESGNLDRVVMISPTEYDLYMRPDTNARGHH